MDKAQIAYACPQGVDSSRSNRRSQLHSFAVHQPPRHPLQSFHHANSRRSPVKVGAVKKRGSTPLASRLLCINDLHLVRRTNRNAHRNTSAIFHRCPAHTFLLDGKAFSLLYGCRMKPKSETEILRQAEARDSLLHGGTVASFLRPYHPDLRFEAFRAYIGAVRDALFRPRKARRQSKRAS